MITKDMRARYRKIRVLFTIRTYLKKFMMDGDPDIVAAQLLDWSQLVEPEIFSGYGRKDHHWLVSAALVLAEGLSKFGEEDPTNRAAIHGALGAVLERIKRRGCSLYEVSLIEGALKLFLHEDMLRKIRMGSFPR